MKKKTHEILSYDEWVERELNKGWYIPYLAAIALVLMFVALALK